MKFRFLILLIAAVQFALAQPKDLWKDPTLSNEKRVNDLVSKMTLEEKISQMMDISPAISRLSVPEYYWWNEALHGLARAGKATVFPQVIGMAASFDDSLLFKVATAISDEARAKHHLSLEKGTFQKYMGLNFWSPNINIFRDPRWGRGQETYGEDPYLTSRMGVAFIKGLQGNDPKYYKVIATPKHFAVHSGPEPDRHVFNAIANQKDLYETYLPAFKAAIMEAKAGSIMGAYNRTNGEACCASNTLLQKILKNEWGFKGLVVSDCGAIDDIYNGHKIVKTAEEAAALAVKMGCHVECGEVYKKLKISVEKGLISEKEIDETVKKIFMARFSLGMFDPKEMVPYSKISPDVIASEKHKKLALQMARESIVLLKNENNILPLSKDVKSIAIIGPTGNDNDVLVGNYNGHPSNYNTILEGIINKVSPATRILDYKAVDIVSSDTSNFEIVKKYIAAEADVIIATMGLTPNFEGEEQPITAEGFYKGDRTSLKLPGVQEKLLKALKESGKPVILVLTSGSPIAVNWAQENIPGIVMAWYPGEKGGDAVADVLFGDYVPSGRLPITFPKSEKQLPAFSEYGMKGRTYRYMKEEPLYPFGFGLSYSSFKYTDLKVSEKSIKAGGSTTLEATIVNTGKVAGDEVVQLYISDLKASVEVPIYALKRFQRISLKPGESGKVIFKLDTEMFKLINNDGKSILEPGDFRISIGGSTPNKRSLDLGSPKPLETIITIK